MLNYFLIKFHFLYLKNLKKKVLNKKQLIRKIRAEGLIEKKRKEEIYLTE